MKTNPVTVVEENGAHKTTEIGAEVVVDKPTVILHTTVGHMKCVPIQLNTAGPRKKPTKIKRYGVTICWSVRETEPDRLGQYQLIKLM